MKNIDMKELLLKIKNAKNIHKISSARLIEIINIQSKERITATDLSRINKDKFSLISEGKLIALNDALDILLAEKSSKIQNQLDKLDQRRSFIEKDFSQAKDILEQLTNREYYSYSIFDVVGEKLNKNLWIFYGQDENGVEVIRIGGDGKSCKGFIKLSGKNLFFQLENNIDPREQLSYVAEFDRSTRFPLRLIGLGINSLSKPVAGKELLFPVEEAGFGKKNLAQLIPLSEQTKLEDQTLEFFTSKESSIYSLEPISTNVDDAFVGTFFAYYLKSYDSNLVKNKIEISKSGDRINFKYYTELGSYHTVSTFYHHDVLFVLMKDVRLDSYITFHIKEIQSNIEGNIEYLIGSTSCIGRSTRLPVASIVFLVRATEGGVKEIKFGKVSNENLSERELQIKKYLKFKAANPIRINPLKISEESPFNFYPDPKNEYFNNLNETIFDSTDLAIRITFERFIKRLSNILYYFSNERSVTLRFEHLDMFRVFYADFLQSCIEKMKKTKKPSKIFATSFPNEWYLWMVNNSTENEIRKFIDSGGKCTGFSFIKMLKTNQILMN